METNNQPMLLPFSAMEGRVMDSDLGIGMEAEPENHPNFIKSNTQAITLDELENTCVVPTFSDNTLTISHQNFI